jgi:hypothetical protein
MQYFILHKDQQNANLLIGEDNGFGVFWADQGLKALMDVVDKKPNMLEYMEIKTDKNETLSISEFLERIKKLQVRVQK